MFLRALRIFSLTEDALELTEFGKCMVKIRLCFQDTGFHKEYIISLNQGQPLRNFNSNKRFYIRLNIR